MMKILNGLAHWYLEEQLIKFQLQETWRWQKFTATQSAQTMHKAANMLNPEQIDFLAKWYASQTPVPTGMSIQGDAENISRLFINKTAQDVIYGGPGKFFTGSPSKKANTLPRLVYCSTG